MFEMIGSLIGAGLSYLGASNAQAQQAQQSTGAYRATQIGQEARMLGVSPLALLGQNFQPSSPINVFGDAPSAGAGAGQGLDRAALANRASAEKSAALDLQAKQLQVQGLQNDVVAGMMRNSVNARTFAAAGNPPGIENVPLPRPSPFTENTLPLYQDFRDRAGGRITLLSPDASQAVMNAASLPVAPAVGAGLVGANIPNFWSALRPDVYRSLVPNIEPDPGFLGF